MGSRGRRRTGARRAAHGRGKPKILPGAASPEATTPRTTLRGPGEGRADRRRALKRIKRRRRRAVLREIPILVGVALLIALVLKTFLVQPFVIPSGSMEQTIKINDRVLVDKLTPWFGVKPQRGDVIVFKDPGGWLEGQPAGGRKDDGPALLRQARNLLMHIGLLPSEEEDDLIKRVIGVGGDTVRCCDENGRIVVNGVPINEPYLHPGDQPSQREFSVTVPEGRYFVMGDHRSNSADSRYHLHERWQGTIPDDLVVGRAVVIAWPYQNWRRLEERETYASVPDGEGTHTSAQGTDAHRMAQLPSPVELPLVMGVVGLHRVRDRRQRRKRSGSGGRDGRRTAR